LADNIGLGLEIVFDQKSLNQLNYIINAVKNIQKQFDGLAAPLKQTTASLEQVSKKVNDIRDANMKLIKAQETISKNGKTIVESYKNLDGTVSKITTQYNRQNEITNQSVKIHQNLGKAVNSIGNSIGNAIQKMALWSTSGFLLFGVFRGIVGSMKTMAELETQAVNIAKVLPEGVKVQPFEQSAISLAKEYGQSVLDVEGAMQQWARQYKNVNDISVMTRASLLAATATDISFGESVTTISAIMAEWNFTTEKSIHVVNVLNEMSNNYRSTANDLASALTKTSAGAKAVGLSFEELTGIVTTGIQALGISGDEVGTMWTRVMARIKGNKSAKEAFSALGIDSDGSLSEMMNQLMVKWDQLSQAQKQNFAITVAGTHHWSKFIGIMENYDTVLQATAKSYFSFNSAQKEVDNVMATLAKKIGQLNAAWEQYIHRNSGALNIQKQFIDSLRYIIQGLSQMPTGLTAVIVGIIALTAGFFALRNAFLASNLALGLFTKSLLMNPWTAAITGLTILATTLFFIGKNAESTADQIANLQTKVAGLNQEIEGNINKVRGITDMSQKYQILAKAINEARERGENYTGLQNKLNAVIGELAKAYGKTNSEMEIWISKDGGMAKFAQNRISELVAELNLKRQIAYEDEKKIAATQGMTKLTSFVNGGEEVKKAFDIYYKSMNLQDTSKYQKNDKELYDKVIGSLDGSRGMEFGQELAARFRAITDFEKNSKPSNLTVQDILNQTGGINTGDGGDPDAKIKNVFSTLTEENIKFIEMIGKEWDKKFGFEADKQRFYNQKTGLDKTINVSSESSSQLTNVFEEVNKIEQKFAEALAKVETERQNAQKAGPYTPEQNQQFITDQVKAYDTYIAEQQKKVDELVQITASLDPNTPNLQAFLEYIDLLKKKIEEVGGSKPPVPVPPKPSEKGLKGNELKLANSAIDTLTSGLVKLGGAAEIAAPAISNALKSLAEGKGFDIKSFGTDLLSSGLNALVNALFAPAKRYEAYQRDRFELAPIAAGAKANTSRTSQISDYQQKIAEANYNIAYNAPKNQGMYEYIRQQKQLIESYNLEIQKLNDAILANIDSWSKAIGVSVNDIANSISDAFQGNTYTDFLTNWNQSLLQMTKDGLIKGFLSKEIYQGMYQKLSDSVALAVLDGNLTAVELTNIKQQGSAIATAMAPLYEALSVLNSAFPGTNQDGGGSQNFTAGSSVPITYNNWITIEAGIFMGDEDQARTVALWLKDYIVAEESRG
jgi:TP901 family phage tail tape measure protein